MTAYTVAMRDAEGPNAQTTADLDEALDWFTNGATEVMDPDGDVTYVGLTVDGVLHGVVQRGGLAPEGGEVIDLKTARAA